MKKLRSIFALAIGLGILAMSTTAAQAQSPESVWKKAAQRLGSMKDYTLLIDYTGPKGTFKYEYACVRPDAIKTKIVQGDNAGAILIYRPSEFGQAVKARKGILGKTLALDDPKVANSAVIKPVYDMLLDAVKGATAVASKGDETIYGHGVWVLNVTTPSGQQEIAVDKATYDVLRWKNPAGETRVFYDIKINTNPRINF